MNLLSQEVNRKIKFLKLAQKLGNVHEAARIMGYSARTYYNLKKIYDEEGEEGLRLRSKRKPKYSLRVSKEIENKILDISSRNPKWGALKIKRELEINGIKISETATYDILKRHGLNLRYKRIEKIKYREDN